MKQDTTATRRSFLQATGALGVGSAIALTGCIGSWGSGGTNNSSNVPSDGDASIREKYGLPELDYDIGNTLNVFQWTGYWPTKTVSNFEKAYGVNVNISNFASNPEMFNKLRAGGSGQFDVIFPTQNILFVLKSQGLIQPLNKKKISTWKNLAKKWRNQQSYDPGNERYSMPYMWGISGVSWNTNMVNRIEGDPLSWDVMWNKQYRNQLTMLNSARESLGVSLMRLGYSPNAKDQAKIEEAKDELIKQKSLLKTYNSTNTTEYLRNKTASPVHTWNGDAMQAYEALTKNGKSPIKFRIPKEGGIKWLDTMAITKKAAHVNAAHAFGTFLLNANVGAELAAFNGYSTPNKAAKQYLSDSRTSMKIINPSDATMKRLKFVNRFAKSPEIAQYYNEAWTEVQNA